MDDITRTITDDATRTLHAWCDARRARGQSIEIVDIRVRPTTTFHARGATHHGHFGVQYARATIMVNGVRRNVFAHVSGDRVFGTWRYA